MSTHLEICHEVAAAGEAGLKSFAANPRFRSASGHAQAARFQSACDAGLIDGSKINQAHHYLRLTDAGRFYLKTSETGPAAHDVLADIEAEMAGEA